MNQFGSYRNHENRPLSEETPLQGLYEVRRAKSFFKFLVPYPPRGCPFGGGGIHRTYVEG
jgi:hypothetical protein